jgi:TonB family protein
LSLLAVCAPAQNASEPVLKSYDPLVYPPIARAARVSGQVTVEFSINNKGETASVSTTSGPAMLRESAGNFVKSWKFDLGDSLSTPETKYQATIQYMVVEKTIDPRDVTNPTVHSDSFHHFKITVFVSNIYLSNCPTGADEDVPPVSAEDDYVEISRSGCMGSCPPYSVKVQADGTVAWNGGGLFVKVKGRREARIDANIARNLLEKFRTKEFWSYCGNYSRNITDSSGTEITVRLGGKTRTISDYADSSPDELQQLLLDVDRIADSHRWRHGDPAKEPITRIAEDTYLPKPGVTPMMLAAARKEVDKLKALIDTGGNVNETDASGWSVLMYAARSSSSFPVQMLLKAGADPNQSSPHGDTPLMVSCLDGLWDDDLVKAGANVNAQNRDGQTALMMLATRDEVDEIRDALNAGSDASLKDKKGRTALDYLRLASCGKSPLYDPVTDDISGFRKCTAFPEDELRAAEKLLEDALRQKH